VLDDQQILTKQEAQLLLGWPTVLPQSENKPQP